MVEIFNNRFFYTSAKEVMLVAIGFLIFSSTHAQYTIKGNISYKTGNLSFVTVRLSQAKSIVSSTISDEKGKYNLKVENSGVYTIKFSRVGFKNTDTTFIINHNIELNQILVENINELKNVTVLSSLPVINRKVNGYDFEIEKSFLATGNNVNTILPLLPGVIMYGEGNISLNNGSVLIMIDNQEIKLPASQLGLYLNNIHSENIKHIEVITYPSAAYDAEGIGGVIKIVTKKKMDDSYSGSISNKYMQGVYPKDELSANIMISRKKVLAYAGLSGSVNNTFAKLENSRENSQTNILQEGITQIKNEVLGYSANTGIRYNINPKNSLVLDLNYGSNNATIRNNEAIMSTNLYYNNILDTTIESYIPQNSKTKIFSVSSNYNRNTDSLGSNLKISGDYLIPVTHSYNGFYNAYFSSNNTFIDSIINDNTIDKHFGVVSLKIDRHEVKVLPKKKRTVIDFGAKFSAASTSVDNFYRNYSGKWVIDNDLTNSLQYNENIYAGYISTETKAGKAQLIGGLRMEYTKYKIFSSTSSIKNDYLNLFPNLSFQVPLNKKNTTFWGMHYSKRISRPSYEILNPFVYKIDQYSLKEGNPLLDPAVSNKISTDINFKKNYNISISYEIEKNTFGEVQKPLGNITLQTFDNLSRKNEFDLVTTANISIKKFWMMVWQIMLYDRHFISPNYTAQNTGALIANVNIFRFSPSFDARLTTQFFTKGADRFTTFNKNFLFSSLDLNKALGKRGLQLKLGANDIFNARGNMSLTYQYLTQNNTSISKRDSRYIYVALIYNFKKGKAIKKPEYQKSNIDEEQRTK